MSNSNLDLSGIKSDAVQAALSEAQVRYDRSKERAASLRECSIEYLNRLCKLALVISSETEEYVERIRKMISETDFEKLNRPSGVFDYLLELPEVEGVLEELEKELPILPKVLEYVRQMVAVFDERVAIEEANQLAEYQIAELAKARLFQPRNIEVQNTLTAASELIEAELRIRKQEYRPSYDISNILFDILNEAWEIVDTDEKMEAVVGMLKSETGAMMLEELMKHPMAEAILPFVTPYLQKAGVSIQGLAKKSPPSVLEIMLDDRAQFLEDSGESEERDETDERELTKLDTEQIDEVVEAIEAIDLDMFSGDQFGIFSGDQFEEVERLERWLTNLAKTVDEASRWAIFLKLKVRSNRRAIKEGLGLEGDPPTDKE